MAKTRTSWIVLFCVVISVNHAQVGYFVESGSILKANGDTLQVKTPYQIQEGDTLLYDWRSIPISEFSDLNISEMDLALENPKTETPEVRQDPIMLIGWVAFWAFITYVLCEYQRS